MFNIRITNAKNDINIKLSSIQFSVFVHSLHGGIVSGYALLSLLGQSALSITLAGLSPLRMHGSFCLVRIR